MKNDNRDDDSWENQAVNEGGDRFFDEWEKEDFDGFIQGHDIVAGKSRHNISGNSKTVNFLVPLTVIAIFLLLGSLFFKGCDIGSVRMVDSNKYVTKTARVHLGHKYYWPWAALVVKANSPGFKGYLNMETGMYKFYYICDEAKFEQQTKGTVSIIHEDNKYKLSGGPVEGEIIMTSSEWGNMTLKIQISFEAKG